MRFATWQLSTGQVEAGIVTEEGLRPFPDGRSILDVVRGGLMAALTLDHEVADSPVRPLEDVRLLPPLNPPAVRDFVAFEEHVEGVVASVAGGGGVVPEWYEAPTFYFTNPHSLVGAHDDVRVPSESQLLDFELEVAVVCGRDITDATPAQADDAIFGYTVMNDWSARDLQRREMKVLLGPAKGKDFASTLGPWIVTADEVENHVESDGFLALEMSVSVNGRRVGHDLLSNMGWPFPHLISYASANTWVRAGDVLGSGTCGNGGCLAELWGRAGRTDPPALQVGDVVEMTVQGLGTISNRIVPGTPAAPVQPARSRSRVRSS